MSLLHRLLVFVGLLVATEAFNCPKGSDQIPREDVCLFTITEPKFYLDAYRRCLALGGVTAKIQNVYENSYLFVSIPQDANGVPLAPYIGVERKENNTWTYADGTPLVYQNWGLNEPNVSSNTSLCAIMDPATGKWLSSECSFSRPFFCSIDGDDFQCPSGWIYFKNNKTDSCYFLQNFTYPDSIHWQVYNWNSAELDCKRMGAHLVSIHLKEEDDFIYGLIPSNVNNQPNGNPLGNNPCDGSGSYYVWIGYYGQGRLGSGTWTDGSTVDYIGGKMAPTSDSYAYVMGDDQSCGNDHVQLWGRATPAYSFARFICKMASRSSLQQNYGS